MKKRGCVQSVTETWKDLRKIIVKQFTIIKGNQELQISKLKWEAM